jgi:hypothetical protein
VKAPRGGTAPALRHARARHTSARYRLRHRHAAGVQALAPLHHTDCRPLTSPHIPHVPTHAQEVLKGVGELVGAWSRDSPAVVTPTPLQSGPGSAPKSSQDSRAGARPAAAGLFSPWTSWRGTGRASKRVEKPLSLPKVRRYPAPGPRMQPGL